MLVGWGSGWLRSWVLLLALALTAGLAVVPVAVAEEPSVESPQVGQDGSAADDGGLSAPMSQSGDGSVEPPAGPASTGADVAADVEVPLELSELAPPEAVEELVSLRRENTKFYLDESGRTFAQVFSGPVHVEDEEGQLVDIDLRLREDGDRLVPARPLVDVSMKRRVGGGRAPLVSVETAAGPLSWSLVGAADVVSGFLAGSDVGAVPEGIAGGHESSSSAAVAVEYRGVMPGVDLRVKPTNGGVKDELVLAGPDSPRVFTFDLELPPGTDASLSDLGDVIVSDDEGTQVAFISRGWMWDSSEHPATGAAAESDGVAYALQQSGTGGTELVVTLDDGWLDDPDRVWPVVVDPEVRTSTTDQDTFIKQGATTNWSGETYLSVGDNGHGLKRSLLEFDINQYEVVKEAELSVYRTDALAGCSQTEIRAYLNDSAWNSSTVTWATQPVLGDFAGKASFCTDGRHSIPISTAAVQSWSHTPSDNHGIQLRARYESDTGSFKKLRSRNSSTHPYLYVTYYLPKVPGDLAPGNGATVIGDVTFQASYQHEAGGQGAVQLEVFNSSGLTVVNESLWGAHDVPVSYSASLSPGDYTWRVRSGSEFSESDWSTARSLTVVAPLPPDTPTRVAPADDGRYTAEPPWQVRYTHPQDLDGQLRYWVLRRQPDGTWVNVVDHYDDVQHGQYSTPSFGLGEGDYRWKVRARDSNGTWSTWTSYWDFNISADNGIPPEPPTGLTSSHKVGVVSNDPTIDVSWTASTSSDVEGYEWDFTHSHDQPIVSDTHPTTSATSSARLPGSHWFRVRTVDVEGLRSEPVTIGPFEIDYELPGLGLDGWGGWANGVNATLSNLVHVEEDVDVAGVGPRLHWTRTYNSRDLETASWMGQGWSTPWEMSARWRSDNTVVVRHPDGRREVHTDDGAGGFTPPSGHHSVLVDTGSGFTLTAKDDTVFEFAPDPVKGDREGGALQRVVDRNGHSVSLEYGTDDLLDTVTDDTSGRFLDLAWQDGVVDFVETNAVAAHGGRLRWDFHYVTATDGTKLLSRACDPRPDYGKVNVCTEYGYDGNGLLTAVTRPEDTRPTLSAAYDMLNDPQDEFPKPVVLWRQDGEGGRTTFDVDLATNTVTVVGPRGNDITEDPDAGTEPYSTSAGHKAKFTTVIEYDDEYRETKRTDPNGGTTTYRYDAGGNRDRIEDPNGNVVTMVYDDRGNLVSTTDADGHTLRHKYREPTGPDDNDINIDDLEWTRSRRSANGDDDTFQTTYGYDAVGNRTSETTPATHDHPNGLTRRWDYTDGTEAAIGGGTMPPGLVAEEVDLDGDVTTHAYDQQGNKRRTVLPSDMIIERTFDELGRLTSRTESSDSFPSGVTETTDYDELGNKRAVTGPVVHDADGQPTHQLQTQSVYDGNNRLREQVEVDLVGNDATRTTEFGYDDADREDYVRDPEGGELVREFDAAGNVKRVTDQENLVIDTDFDTRNLPEQRIARNVLDDPGDTTPRDVLVATYGHDPAGRLTSETDAEGRQTTYAYDGSDRRTRTIRKNWIGVDANGDPLPARDVVVQDTVHDADGNVAVEATGDGTTVTVHHIDPAGRTFKTDLDPSSIAPTWGDGSGLPVGVDQARLDQIQATRPSVDRLDRTTTWVRNADGDPQTVIVTQDGRTETTAHGYHPTGDWRTSTSRLLADGTKLKTTWSHDQRGNVLSETDPRGNADGVDPADHTFDYTYDELGRKLTELSPPVNVTDDHLGLDDERRRLLLWGYDTWGNQAFVDETGAADDTVDRARTSYVYDRLDRQVKITHPIYRQTHGTGEPMTPTEHFAYDAVGNLIRETSRRGFVTEYVHDSRHRLVEQHDPAHDAQPGDEPAGGVWRYTHDDVGNRTSEVDPTAVRTEWTHDELDNVRTTTEFADDGTPHTALTGHDPAGRPTYQRTAEGVVTQPTYDAQGNTVSTTDAGGNTASWTYDVADRQVAHVDELDRRTEHTYDLAGRKTATKRFDASGTMLNDESWGHDEVGNVTFWTSPRGHTTTHDYNALDWHTETITPTGTGTPQAASVTYDLRGNQRQFRQRPAGSSDPAAYSVQYSYNLWHQPITMTEQQTEQHPDLEDYEWRFVYDIGGLKIETQAPGGIVVTNEHDAMGRLTTEHGEGPDRATSERTHSWDEAGRRTTVSHPDGTQTYSYDTRGLLDEASGPAGDATFDHNGDRQLDLRTDAAGTTRFGYDDRGLLDTAELPSGATLRWSPDEARQPEFLQAYNADGEDAYMRRWIFDGLGRVQDDVTYHGNGNGVLAGRYYSYDKDGNPTRVGISHADTPIAGLPAGQPQPAEGTHTFGYDQAGRITSWTDHAGEETVYEWDRNGNRTRAGDTTYTYDDRNRLVTAGELDYDWNPDGTLARAGTTLYDFDALGRATSIGGVPFTYDGLDRIATRGLDQFTYNDTGLDPVADPTGTYTKSPAGRILEHDPATTGGVDGLPVVDPDPVLAGLDRHGDLGWLIDPDTSQLTGTKVYDPFGQPIGTTGINLPDAGFQGDYTDPLSGEVWQGARWYQPDNGTFTARDTVHGELRTPITLNRYLYANASPLRYFDPDGRYGFDGAPVTVDDDDGWEATRRLLVHHQMVDDNGNAATVPDTGGASAEQFADAAARIVQANSQTETFEDCVVRGFRNGTDDLTACQELASGDLARKLSMLNEFVQACGTIAATEGGRWADTCETALQLDLAENELEQLAETLQRGLEAGYSLAELIPGGCLTPLAVGDDSSFNQGACTTDLSLEVVTMGAFGWLDGVGAGLRRLLRGADDAPRLTGTVWDDVVATGSRYADTEVPTSFRLTAGGSEVWVHPNVTEHLAERVLRAGTNGPITTQSQIRSLQAAIAEAAQGGLTPGRYDIGGWALEFSQRATDELIVVKHGFYHG